MTETISFQSISPRCGDCRFYNIFGQDNTQNEEKTSYGECRINPPIIDDSEGGFGQWALVREMNWCGAFEPGTPPADPAAAVIDNDNDNVDEEAMAGLGALFG